MDLTRSLVSKFSIQLRISVAVLKTPWFPYQVSYSTSQVQCWNHVGVQMQILALDLSPSVVSKSSVQLWISVAVLERPWCPNPVSRSGAPSHAGLHSQCLTLPVQEPNHVGLQSLHLTLDCQASDRTALVSKACLDLYGTLVLKACISPWISVASWSVKPAFHSGSL